MGRVVHLLPDLRSGRIRDPFEGTAHELGRQSPDQLSFDISPDNGRICFACNPTTRKVAGNPTGLTELELNSGRFTALTNDPAGHYDAPRYSPDGAQPACIASHSGLCHTRPGRVALDARRPGPAVHGRAAGPAPFVAAGGGQSGA